jgi:cytidylate kinase
VSGPVRVTQQTEAGFTGVVALDGPSGTGKSTVARTLARRLGVAYLDTGAMYRAITALVLRAGVDPKDSDAVAAVADRAMIEISTDPDELEVRADGHDVTAEIRSIAVTAAVSPVSAVPGVRRKLVDQQRQLIARGAIVVEGRDIASVVWPQAELKVYLTASTQVRAQRRAGETGATDVHAVAADLARRDSYDSSRADSPLLRVDGAQELDTSELDIDGVVTRLIALAGE